MRTGPHLKGKAVSPTQGRTRNQPDVSRQELRSKAVAPTQGRTRNHPSTAPTPKTNISGGTARTYFGNSRTPVDSKFAKLDAKHNFGKAG